MTGDVAVVSGGTRGIGRAVSLALAATGRRVYAVYARDREAAAAVEQEAAGRGLELRALPADLRDDDLCRGCVETILGQTDQVGVIVHAAASGVHREVDALTPRHLAWTFDVNVLSLQRLLAGLLPAMPRGGRIVGLTSHGGTRALPHYAAVGASKGALESLLRHYAVALAPRGIAVNLVCPGLVLTDALDAFPDRRERVEAALAKTPSGRLTTPEDVAAAVVFLCSPAAAQIVGQTLVVDGGRALV